MNETNVVFTSVPVAKLMESPRNFRKRYDEDRLAELAANVKMIGIKAPLLCRPIKNGKPWLDLNADLLTADSFEIAAGHRRSRAAKMAGLATVPAVIQVMTDEAFLEVLSVENLQREDIHALEEAEGYRDLLKLPGYDAHVIAAKIGKPVLYVQRRLSLLRLIGEVKKAFEDRVINPAMAQIIARLTPEDQKGALARITNADRYDQVKSSRQLQAWVERDLMLSLRKAPFDPKDADLVPAAGKCADCPKRTGFMPDLFPEVKSGDTCTDRRCYATKKQATLLIQIRAIAEKNDGVEPVLVSSSYGNPEKYAGRPVLGWGRYSKASSLKGGKPSCEHQKNALVVHGQESVGKLLEVCTNPRCKIHGRGRHSGNETPKQAAERAKEEFDDKVESATRRAVLKAASEAFPPAVLKDWIVLARLVFRKFGNSESQRAISRAYAGIEVSAYEDSGDMDAWFARASTAQVQSFIFEAALYECLTFYGDPGDGEVDELLAAAARRNVDVQKIRAEIEADLQLKELEAKDRALKRAVQKEQKNAKAKARKTAGE